MNSNTYGSSHRGWNPIALLNDLYTAWRLLWHPRVPFILKLFLPVLAAIYWVWPLDLIPGVPIDDIAVLLLAARFFVQMAPADVLDELRGRWGGGLSGGHSPGDASSGDDANTVSTTWRVIDDE